MVHFLGMLAGTLVVCYFIALILYAISWLIGCLGRI